VEWTDNAGLARERHFKTRRAAEKFTLKVEVDLMYEAVQNFNEAFAALSP
jgi:hypothetical protein